MDSAEGLPRSASRTLREPLLQPVDASVVTSLSSNVEKLKRRRVHLLNFAYLALGDGSLLGAGGSARVYKALYRGRPVAVKSLFCMELTSQHVVDFTREASRLQQFQSPYIVALKGVCIRPPLLAMVLELCEYGSLNDVLTTSGPNKPAVGLGTSRSGIGVAMVPMGASAERSVKIDVNGNNTNNNNNNNNDDNSFRSLDLSSRSDRTSLNGLQSSASTDSMSNGMERSSSTSSTSSVRSMSSVSDNSDRESIEPITLSWRNRLVMAYQCAQAVALLHNHNPPVVHLDIKSHNMLVARSRGALRDLVPFQIKISDLELSVTAASVGHTLEKTETKANVPQTINWTAPELFGIDGAQNVTIMSDCYALGMVLYEVRLCRYCPSLVPANCSY
jgi:hypothetical protein